MAEAVLRISFAGPHVTLQDAGRPGFQRFGVPESGPLDRLALAAANAALGNAADAPGIEISPGGLTLDCLSGRLGFAVAGGGFVLDHAGRRGGSWSRATLVAGQRLTIRPGRWGSWCYLALAGDPDRPAWLGSRATHALSGLGGGAVSTGQTLRLRDTRPGPTGPETFPCPVLARPRPQLHVTAGPQLDQFLPAALATLSAGPWHLTDARDRMGVRLRGPHLVPVAGALDIPSGPVPRGAVQVAGDGVATILLADHQTTGGYPRIATVLDCDLDGLAQLRPGDPLGFVPVSAEAAITIARSRARATAGYLASLRRG